ncbi:hypothetical protein KAW18_11900 [candidate division WOR-3 bacterium]|nr:hypothetical protein [candidate division WOR-3 bacterium]MCK4528064.1 hypothetical protein [candidate division WOR-3 bacterium]
MDRKKKYPVFLLIGLSLIGIIVLLFATSWGIGLSPDSSRYIYAARSLLGGRGLMVLSGSGEVMPMVNTPPLFSVLLFILGFFGIDPLSGVRWLNTFFFGANILLSGFLIRKNTHNSIYAAILGSFLIMTSVDMIYIHSMAWSESSFIFFCFLGIFLLNEYLKGQKPLFLVASSGAIALAFLDRYSGAALIPTGIVGILFLQDRTRVGKIRDSIIFLALTCLPMVFWLIRNLIFASSATERQLCFHPVTSHHLLSALFTISKWLFPESTLYALSTWLLRDKVFYGVIGVVIGLLISGIFLLSKKGYSDRICSCRQYITRLSWLLIAFVFFYGMLLLVSISFFDANTPLSSRILSPIYISSLVLILSIGDKLFHSIRRKSFLRILLIIICTLFAGSYLVRGTKFVIQTRRTGLVYDSKAWKESKIVERIKRLPPGIPIFSNGADAIYLLTKRPAALIPAKVDPSTTRNNDTYLFELERMRKKLETEDGVLIYFNTVRLLYFPSEKELKEQLPLRLLSKESDGAIYQIEQPAPTPH